MTDHCPACRVARELTEHRDAYAAEWSQRRAALNFAAIVARRACVEYATRATESGPVATNSPSPGPTPAQNPASAQEDA